MRKIYCDFCRKEIGDISSHGVEMKDGDNNLVVCIGKAWYKDVCAKCYGIAYEFVEKMKRR